MYSQTARWRRQAQACGDRVLGLSLIRSRADLRVCWKESAPLPSSLARAFPFPVVGIRIPVGLPGWKEGIGQKARVSSLASPPYTPERAGGTPGASAHLHLWPWFTSLPSRMRTLFPYSLGKGMKSQGREGEYSWFSHYIEVFHSN